MAIESILTQIDAEIAKLKQVRLLLASTGKVAVEVTEPITKKKAGKASKTSPVGKKAKKHRVLSPEARKRIADAQRKRWAAQKVK
jgi:hypothetical protein